jgi:MtN3 and saliva related transmembrane protein
VPQVRKVVAGQPTDDLSLTTLIALTAGLALWIVYGLMKGDMIVLAANSVGALLTGFVLLRKMMDEKKST